MQGYSVDIGHATQIPGVAVVTIQNGHRTTRAHSIITSSSCKVKLYFSFFYRATHIMIAGFAQQRATF